MSQHDLVAHLEAHSPLGMVFVDVCLRIVRVNPAFAAMQGVTPEHIEGQRVCDAAAGLWPQLEALFRAALDRAEPCVNVEVKGEMPYRPGEWGAWLVSVYPVMDGARVTGAGSVIVDVSERQRAEQFRAVVTDTMVEGVLALDHCGCVQYANSAACELLGRAEGDLLGGPFAPEDQAILDARVASVTTRHVEGTFPHGDGGTVPVAYSAAPLPGGDGSVRGVVVVFRDRSAELAAQAEAQRELADLITLSELRHALDEDRLTLHAQPIVPLDGGAPSVELLVRMIAPDGRIVSPADFLPVAEAYGLITEVDRWVIARAALLAGRGRHVHINLSAKSTTDPGLFPFVEQELRAARADPAKLAFELTETALMSDWEVGTEFARRLVGLGCGLALDDFGTGFASLTYLKALPINRIKIDVDFVRDLATSKTNQHLVQAIVHLAHGLGIETVAEGVEDEEALALLRGYGVDYAQGYYLGRPVPVDGASMAACTSPTRAVSTS
jgi:PAS domain S-box-containing protein